MSEYEDFNSSDYDPHESAGIPRDLTQRRMLSEAIGMASNIHRELVGQVDGMLVDYIRYASLEASKAAANLLTMHPKSDRELFELQKLAAPYASVIEWVRKYLVDGANAERDLHDLMEKEEQQEQQDE